MPDDLQDAKELSRQFWIVMENPVTAENVGAGLIKLNAVPRNVGPERMLGEEPQLEAPRGSTPPTL